MKKALLLLITLGMCNTATAVGVGFGKVLDVTLRTQDNLMLVRVENPDNISAQASCATWQHTYGMTYSGDMAKAVYSLLLAAQTSGESVKIIGTGSCLSGTGVEDIQEVNIGPWS